MSDICCSQGHRACHYQVAWSINPHMKPGSTDLDLAIEQHANLRASLNHAGATVIQVPFVCGAYDSVFIKDNAFLFRKRDKSYALMARPQFAERRVEQEARRGAYEKRGFAVVHSETEPGFEGGDLVVVTGQAPSLFMGYGFRTELEAAVEISRLTGVGVTPLRLVDPYFYHLDTALCLLDDGTAVACSEAFAPESWKKIEKHPSITRILSVERSEALAFGCNLVQVDDQMILGSFLPRLMRSLKVLGYKVRYAPLTEYQRAGGSAACLVSRIHDLEGTSHRSHAAPLELAEYA